MSIMLSCGADVSAAVPGEELQADCSSGCRVVLLSHFVVSPSLSTDYTALTNSGALVRQRTIPTERPPLVGEVSATFSG
jgi:hypothetical protein